MSLRLTLSTALLLAFAPSSAFAPAFAQKSCRDVPLSPETHASEQTPRPTKVHSDPRIAGLHRPPGNHPPTDIQISNTQLEVVGTGSFLAGELRAVDPDVLDTHAFRLVAGPGDAHNRLFEIDGQTLRYRNTSAPPSDSLSVRVEATDGSASFTRSLEITPQLGAPLSEARWSASHDEPLGLAGYGELMAHYANACGQGWDLTAFGNAAIAFSQTATGFEIAAAGDPLAGDRAAISEISLRPSIARQFDLDSLRLTLFADNPAEITVAGYRQGVAVTATTQKADASVVTLDKGTPEKDRPLLDEVVLIFRPAIEAAELSELVAAIATP